MNGTLYLNSIEEVAQFLSAFSDTGATDVFTVCRVGAAYRVEFVGAK